MLLTSEELPDKALLADALSLRADMKVEISMPQRGEKREIMDRALANAREALGRKLADTSSQRKLLTALEFPREAPVVAVVNVEVAAAPVCKALPDGS